MENETEPSVVTNNNLNPELASLDDQSKILTQVGTRSQPPDHEDQIRLFLAISTVGLMYITAIAAIITGNAMILGTTTIVGVAVIAVFRYFFRRR